MKKVLILSLALILLLGIAAHGTFGLFSDTETSAGNTFTAWVEVCSYATEDSRVESKNPDNNYGSDDTLHTRVKYNAKKDVYELRRAYLKFNIPSCPPSQHVTSATLKVYARGGKKDNEGDPLKKPGTIGIYAISSTWVPSTWSETGITWNNAPIPPGTPPDWNAVRVTSKYVDKVGWVEFDITSAVTGGSTLSLVMKFTDESTTYEQHVDWYSREEETGAYWPLVCVECGSS